MGEPVALVFLLEDNPADVRLFEEAIREEGLDIQLDVAMSVEEGLAYVEALAAGAARPAIAVLDIQLPTGSGIDVLHRMRKDRTLDDLPALMLTTSERDEDIQSAKDGGATTYYVKPMDLDGTLNLVRELKLFWIDRRSP